MIYFHNNYVNIYISIYKWFYRVHTHRYICMCILFHGDYIIHIVYQDLPCHLRKEDTLQTEHARVTIANFLTPSS